MNGFTDNTLPKHRETYQKIKMALLNKEWENGEKLSTSQLAKRFGVSKTPVQDALKQLEFDGFVKIVPQVGCIVRTFTIEDFEELYLLRKSLEGLASSIAATKATEADLTKLEDLLFQMEQLAAEKNYSQYSIKNREFHRTIVAASHMPRLMSQVQWLWDQTDFISLHRFLIHQNIENSIESHKIIFQAIKNNMPQIAKSAMEEHLHECLLLVLNNTDSQNGEQSPPTST
ncbi:GntR family transcriptional regulator [Paenibacillus sp. EPM92]|uniref:GntR family transcriptional regulator n=1 Tax=Paenibacillus sp. EPM92 TaxID=1561195 RepID=UPI001915D998|nr:GntR family transcriptional regulator [Paenibacillus sp. EPM92]